jgi:uncharacterized membrane protein
MSDRTSSVRGAKFFFQLAGGALAAALIFAVIALFVFKALLTWGIVGFLLVLVVVGLVFGWYSDRKAKAERAKWNEPG